MVSILSKLNDLQNEFRFSDNLEHETPESKKSVLKSSSQTQCLSCQLFLHLCSEMAMLSTMREQTRRRAAQAPREPSPLPLRANALAGRPRRQRSRPCWGDPCSDSRGL